MVNNQQKMKTGSKRKITKKGKITQKSQKISKKSKITKVSQEAFGKQVISYYLSLRDQEDAIDLTVQHFIKETRNDKRPVKRIIQRYEERGTWKWDTSKAGRPTKFTSDDEFRRRFQELYNPSLTAGELAALLGVSGVTLKTYMRRLTEDQSRSQSSSDDENNNDADPNLQIFDSVTFNEDAEFMDHSFQDDDDLNQDVKPRVTLDDINLKLEAHAESSSASSPKSKTRRKQNANALLLKTCLICKQTFSQDFPKSTSGNTLEANCDVIFLLRKVLRIEAEELTDLLLLSEGQNPADWYWLCDTCRRFQDEASSIRKQLQELELRMERCRVEFLSEVKQSSEEESKLLSKKGWRRGKRTKSSEMVVVERLRGLILRKGDEQQRQQSLMSFENGDKRAEQLARGRLPLTPADLSEQRSTPQQVEPEIEADFDFDSDLFPPSPAEIDFSDPNPPKLQNPPEFKPMESVKQVPLPKPRQKPKEVTSALPFGITFLPPHSRPTSICDICGKLLKYVSLSTHKLQVHGVVMEGFTAIHCDAEDCPFRTLDPDKLKIHKMKSHGAPRPYACMFCSKRFLTRGQLTDHEDIHRNKDSRPYVCDSCGKRYAVKTYLYIHKRNAHKSR